MSGCFRPASWSGRTSIFACLVLTPFLDFLQRHHYAWWRQESVGIIALLLTTAAVAAALTARRWMFFAAAGTIAAVFLAEAVRRAARASVSVELDDRGALIAAGLVAGAALLAWRDAAFPIMALFCLGYTAAGALVTNAASHAWDGPRTETGLPGAPHQLHLILDEQIGLAGFPAGVPECQRARGVWVDTLREFSFTVYPEAHSNYVTTVDSVPSLLNGVVLPHSYQMVERPSNGWRSYRLKANATAKRMRAAGYEFLAVQNSAIDLTAGESARVLESYEDEMGRLQGVPGTTWEKGRLLIGGYQSSSPFLRRVRGFLPFHVGGRITGPLAVDPEWPRKIAGTLRQARRPVYLLAHLLLPHSPYLYRRDGSVRPIREWSNDRGDRTSSPEEWRATYTRYCEQSEFAANRTGLMLRELSRDGALDTMTVIIHGDHGPRIRLATGNPVDHSSPELVDGAAGAAMRQRDWLDLFSVLVAIRAPGSRGSGRQEPGARSLMVLLAGSHGAPLGERAGLTFLFDRTSLAPSPVYAGTSDATNVVKE